MYMRHCKMAAECTDECRTMVPASARSQLGINSALLKNTNILNNKDKKYTVDYYITLPLCLPYIQYNVIQ